MLRTMRLLIAGALIAFPLFAASPAYAASGPCDAEGFANSGYELFTPQTEFVPPPLRVANWSCAYRLSDRPFGFDTGVAVEYSLFYQNVQWDTLVQIVRAFEDQNWLQDEPGVTSIDLGSGMKNSVRYSSADLASLKSAPLFASGRFGNSSTHHDIISLSYADGDSYHSNGNDVEGPSLVVTVYATSAYSDTGLADPSILSTLKTIGSVQLTPAGAGILGGAAVMLTLVIGYPGALLNSVIGQYWDKARDRIKKAKARRQSRAPRKTTEPIPGTPKATEPEAVSSKKSAGKSAIGWTFILGLVISAVISGFVDPSFGINAMSARVLLTAFLSLMVFNVTAWILVRKLMLKRHPESPGVIKFRWGSLVLVALAVVIARLLQFNPGVIFGLVAGLTFAIALSKAADATVVILSSGFGLGVAVIAWVAYSLLSPLIGAVPGNALAVFASEFFSAVTIEGIASLPLALLPLVALDGHKLFSYKKWLWALCYAIGILAFLLVLLTIPKSWTQIPGDFARWVILFAAFGIFAIVVWTLHAILSKRKSRHPQNVASSN
ncbi:MAG: hypothetical protein IT192_05740 [Microbacteriaceae bacterium]|nr:hypothetical protein [Microbacteriaceae bacterium]